MPARQDAFCGRSDGLRVASTLLLPHLRQCSRLTNVAIGAFGGIASPASVSRVNTPTCRQCRHSTVTPGSVRTLNPQHELTSKNKDQKPDRRGRLGLREGPPASPWQAAETIVAIESQVLSER